MKDKEMAVLSYDNVDPKPSLKVPTELLQQILNLFSNTFHSRFDSSLPKIIQEIKGHLYDRDFLNAFGQEQNLEAYCMRWSPSRALAYCNILFRIPIFAETLFAPFHQNVKTSKHLAYASTEGIICSATANESSLTSAKSGRVVCIGAGAGAEIVALAAFVGHMQDRVRDQQSVLPLMVTSIDVAEWGSIVTRLHSAATTNPPFSKYASAKLKNTTRPLVSPSLYEVHFEIQDVLEMEYSDLAETFSNVTLVTLMFTLNEMYQTSKRATTNLLLALTMLLSAGSLLLVVDSPGSYSTVKLGSASVLSDPDDCSKYPMHWLLDHTLLKSAVVGSSRNSADGAKQWEKLESRESEWFRLPKGLSYPIDLEDMRYQIHLYRRI